MSPSYIFTSQRLGFRTWLPEDIPDLAAINADPAVMEFFPSTQSLQQTENFINRMIKQYEEKHFCYFAVERLDTKEFIGFTGLMEPTYEADFTPCVDIGWRLAQKHWGNGFATEAAKRCLEYAFAVLELDYVVATCPQVNTPSEAVMKKIGMQKIRSFQHPLLTDNERLRECLLYRINARDATL